MQPGQDTLTQTHRNTNPDSCASPGISHGHAAASLRLEIGGRYVGPGYCPMVIAEAGVNHNGCVERAHRLIDAAADAHADAVKFQAFKAELLVTPDAPRAAYQAENTGSSASQYEMLKALELSPADFASLKAHCDERGIMFLCTPFDQPSADMLASLGVVAMKIPSGEVTNTVFLRHLAKLKLPLILSTGMATLEEIREAVATLTLASRGQDEPGGQGEPDGQRETAGAANAAGLVVLHCVSSYPASPKQMNLRVMQTLHQTLGCVVGLSDHTLGTHVSFAAAAMGAAVIEKHFTLDRTLPGPDHLASLEPMELADLVTGVRDVHLAMGTGVKQVGQDEQATAGIVRRSIAASVPIAKGQMITPEMVFTLRPAGGIAPREIDRLVGCTALEDIPQGRILRWGDVQQSDARGDGGRAGA